MLSPEHKFSIQTTLKEIKPVVVDRFYFGYKMQKQITNFIIFEKSGTSKFLMQGPKTKALESNFIFQVRKFLI